MRFRLGLVAVPLVLGAIAARAGAATFTTPDGKTERLTVGQEVTGPGTVANESGKDTIVLRQGAVLRYIGTDTDDKGNKAESYFLKSGACDANVGFYTRLATPSFWAFPEKATARAMFYAETFPAAAGGPPAGYARAAKGSGLVRLSLNIGKTGNLECHLLENQGATLQKAGERDVRFTTDPHNEWRNGNVRIQYPLPTGLGIELYVPKATSGYVAPKGIPGKTDVNNAVASWKSGKINIATIKGGATLQQDDIGPGVTATIDEASGTIETGFVKVEFATLKAAVSLTSEFASLAMSPLSRVK